jgi:hypothetical protein
MSWVALIKAILDFLDSLFNARNNAKHEELGRLKEVERQGELENELHDRISRANPDIVSDDEAFGGKPTGHLSGSVEK